MHQSKEGDALASDVRHEAADSEVDAVEIDWVAKERRVLERETDGLHERCHEKLEIWQRDYTALKWLPYDLAYGKVRSQALTTFTLCAFFLTSLQQYFTWTHGFIGLGAVTLFFLTCAIGLGQALAFSVFALGNNILQPTWYLGLPLLLCCLLIVHISFSSTQDDDVFSRRVLRMARFTEAFLYLLAVATIVGLLLADAPTMGPQSLASSSRAAEAGDREGDGAEVKEDGIGEDEVGQGKGTSTNSRDLRLQGPRRKASPVFVDIEGEALPSQASNSSGPLPASEGKPLLRWERLRVLLQASALVDAEARQHRVRVLLRGARGELQHRRALFQLLRGPSGDSEAEDSLLTLPAPVDLFVHPAWTLRTGGGVGVLPAKNCTTSAEARFLLEDVFTGWRASQYGPRVVDIFGEQGVLARKEALEQEALARESEREDHTWISRLSSYASCLPFAARGVPSKEGAQEDPSFLERILSSGFSEFCLSAQTTEYLKLQAYDLFRGWQGCFGKTPTIVWLALILSLLVVAMMYETFHESITLNIADDTTETLELAAEQAAQQNEELEAAYAQTESDIDQALDFVEALNDLPADLEASLDASFMTTCSTLPVEDCSNFTVDGLVRAIEALNDVRETILLPAINSTIATNELIIADSQASSDVIEQWEKDWNLAVRIGTSVGVLVTVIAILMAPASLILNLRRLESGAVRARGEYNPANFSVRWMPMYVGIAISSAAFGFVLISFLFSAVAFCVINSSILNWILDSYLNAVLAWVLVFVLLKMLFNPFFFEDFTCDGHRIKRPVSFQFTFMALLLYNLFTGFLQAIFRLLFMLGYCFVAVLRLDETIFPKELETCDVGYMCFKSICYFRHHHGNAIMQEACEIFREGGRRLPGGRSTPESQPPHTSCPRARNRWRVAYTLIMNPALVKYRRGISTEEVIKECKGAQISPSSNHTSSSSLRAKAAEDTAAEQKTQRDCSEA